MAKAKVWDVIVIGSGPAGYTAALYTARAKLATLVIAGAMPGGQLILTTMVENFPGFSQGVLGPQLMNEMKLQAQRFGAQIVSENVSKIDFGGEVKSVWVGQTHYQARAVIVTVGAKFRLLNVGEEKFLGRGVSTCATCDAAFFKDKITYVVGGGDVAMEDSLALTKFAKRVTLIHRRDSFRASKTMQDRVLKEKQLPVLWNSAVIGVKGEHKLEAIQIKDINTGEQKELPADGLFIAIGHIPASDFLDAAVKIDSHGYVVTNMTGDGANQRREYLEGYPTATSSAGVFAAGDVVDFRYRQAITAAGMGSMAALDAEKFLTGSTSSW